MDGLLLAAGFSARMGEFKPLLAHDGEAFAVGIAGKMLSVCRRVIVVTGFRGDEVRAAFDKFASAPVEFIVNPDFAQGMFTSLKKGVTALADADRLLYHFCDQPHLPLEFYAELASAIEPGCDGVQPVFEKKSGHPLILGRAVIEAVRSAPATSTLREILQAPGLRLKRWECRFPEILDDWDTPEDLLRLERRRQR